MIGQDNPFVSSLHLCIVTLRNTYIALKPGEPFFCRSTVTRALYRTPRWRAGGRRHHVLPHSREILPYKSPEQRQSHWSPFKVLAVVA